MFTIQCTSYDGCRAVAMTMLPPPPTKPITLHWQRGFSGGGKKKKSTLSHVLKGEEWVTGRWAYDCGCNSWSPLRDAIGSFKKRTHPPLEQYITWTRTTQCPTVQTHTSHRMQEDQAYSKPVVYGSLYPMISRLLQQAQGQTLAEFWSAQATASPQCCNTL